MLKLCVCSVCLGPITVAARTQVCTVSYRLNNEIVGSNPTWCIDVWIFSLLYVVLLRPRPSDGSTPRQRSPKPGNGSPWTALVSLQFPARMYTHTTAVPPCWLVFILLITIRNHILTSPLLSVKFCALFSILGLFLDNYILRVYLLNCSSFITSL
jgi:hypothetical protein